MKQQLLQPLGLRQADLDHITKRTLDLYARVAAKIELYDSWAAEHGFLDDKGNAPPWIKEYYSAIRTADRLLARLTKHLERHLGERPSALEAHLNTHYLGELGPGH